MSNLFKIAWCALSLGGCAAAFGFAPLPPEHQSWLLLPCVATAGWYLGSKEYWGEGVYWLSACSTFAAVGVVVLLAAPHMVGLWLAALAFEILCLGAYLGLCWGEE